MWGNAIPKHPTSRLGPLLLQKNEASHSARNIAGGEGVSSTRRAALDLGVCVAEDGIFNNLVCVGSQQKPTYPHSDHNEVGS